MATLFVMHGLPGVGKTTFALRLARETGAIRFNNDEWLRALVGRAPERSRYVETYARIEDLQWRLARDLLDRDVPVVWDYGTWTRAERARLVTALAETCHNLIFHEVVCSPEEADRRVLARSGGDTELALDQAALDAFRERFEPIAADENLVVRRVASTRASPSRGA